MIKGKPIFTKVILVATLLCLTGQLQGQTKDLQKEIGKIIQYEVKIDFSLVPGLLIGIMDGDRVYTFSVGEKQDKLASYELGAITKPIVAWLAEQAIDSLGWSRDLTVCAFLPDSLCGPGWERVTIDHVLTHRSGLMRLPAGIGEAEINMDDPYVAYDLESFAKDIKPMVPQPGVYNYSHVNYMILYWLFERVGGLDFFFNQRLVIPLAFIQTGFNISDESLAPGHDRNGLKTTPWHCNAMTPALGLRSGLLDLMRFIDHISPELQQQAPSWSSSERREMEKRVNKGIYDVIEGWFLVPDPETWIFYHNGSTGGHHVSIAFIPEKQKACLVISNGALGSGPLSMLILEMLLKAKY